MLTPLTPILAHLQSTPSRTWSIVLTFFGDAVVPRGGSVWLGTILDLFEGMAIGPGAIRTAVSRLSSDDWLERNRNGRNSYYSLSARGVATFSRAERHIYALAPSDWDGRLLLAVPCRSAEDDQFRSHMMQEGFARLAPGAWIGINQELRAGLDADAALVEVQAPPEALRLLVARAWPLERLAATYSRFLEAFAPLEQWCAEGGVLEPREALVARTLLIHEFRRIILRDPLLPAELLLPDWPGHAARALCARIYHALLPLSEAWLDESALDETGPLPPPQAWLHRRLTR